MQKYYYGTANNRCELRNAYVINLNENTSPEPTIEHFVIGKDTGWDEPQILLSALIQCPLVPDATPAFIDIYDNDKFICHLAKYGILFDIDRQCIMMYGIMNDTYRRSLIIHDLCMQLHIHPNKQVLDILSHGKNVYSDNDKLNIAMNDIFDGIAILFIASRKELNKLEKLGLCKSYTIPPGNDLNDHYFTLDQLGILHSVSIKKNMWDKIYPATFILNLAEQIRTGYAVGYTGFQKQIGEMIDASTH